MKSENNHLQSLLFSGGQNEPSKFLSNVGYNQIDEIEEAEEVFLQNMERDQVWGSH